MHSTWLAVAIEMIGVALIASAGVEAHAASKPEQLSEGHLVYRQHCASCHGAKAEGELNWQQPNAQGELPAPPHGPTGHTWKHSDAMLYRIIKEGWRDPFNKTQRLTMPAYGHTLTPEEIRVVISYLKTLWTPEQRRFQREESRHQPFPPEAR